MAHEQHEQHYKINCSFSGQPVYPVQPVQPTNQPSNHPTILPTCQPVNLSTCQTCQTCQPAKMDQPNCANQPATMNQPNCADQPNHLNQPDKPGSDTHHAFTFNKHSLATWMLLNGASLEDINNLSKSGIAWMTCHFGRHIAPSN